MKPNEEIIAVRGETFKFPPSPSTEAKRCDVHLTGLPHKTHKVSAETALRWRLKVFPPFSRRFPDSSATLNRKLRGNKGWGAILPVWQNEHAPGD